MAALPEKSESLDGLRSDRPTTTLAALTALGIVYGDLGTSPLYTLQTIVQIVGGKVTASMMVGILSLIVWALILTISVKYCVFVMRADNHGEGGILILMSLLGEKWSSRRNWLLIAGLFGAALIYGDGIITPSISVLSALEGLNVATNVFRPHIVPIAIGILLALFAIQSHGTAKIGRFSGPVMLLWFITIAALGIAGVAQQPRVLLALNPRCAVAFLAHSGWLGFSILGGVFLAVTGGEALYADMGHIGRNPIRTAWYIVVLPSLLLSYAGQTALLLEHPELTGNPFFHLAPVWALYPLVILATLATIIASQAIITGSFSLTRQAMQLEWLPAVHIRQTSSEEYGQIYVPVVNWTMAFCTVALTIGFGSSVRLAGAYGTAVSTTMLLTTVLLYNVMRKCWQWPFSVTLPLCGIFLLVDFAFFAANLSKIAQGGWIPLTFGAIIFLLMTTWRTGIEAVREKLGAITESANHFFMRLADDKIPRVAGTGVFLTRMDDSIPPPIIDHVAQVGALYETLIALTVVFDEVPRIPSTERFEALNLSRNFWHVTLHYGFMDIPDLPSALHYAEDLGLPIGLKDAVYFASRDEVIRAKVAPSVMRWRLPLFAFMFRNAVRMSDQFNLPPRNFLEVGRQVEI